MKRDEKKYNIIIATPRFYPIVGGGENQARLVAEELIKRGNNVRVVSSRLTGTAKNEMLATISIHRVPSFNFTKEKGLPAILENLLYVFSLIAYGLFRLRQFEVIIFFFGLDYFSIPAFFFKLFGKKSFVRTASTFSPEIGNLRGSALYSLRKKGYAAFDRFLAISTFIEKRFIEEGVKPERIRRMNNGVDTNKFRPLDPERRMQMRETLGLNQDSIYLLYCGHLNANKGIDFLIRSISTLDDVPNNVELLVLGSGKFAQNIIEDSVKKEAKEIQSPIKVHFLGQVADREKYFQAADIFILPSQSEGLPNVLIEARACGLPSIATRVSGVPDVIEEGVDGIIIDYGDEEALRKAIHELTSSSVLRKQFGENALRKILQQYDITVVAKNFETLFREVIA